MTNRSAVFCGCLVLLFATAARAVDKEHFLLPIGDPELSGRDVPLALDVILDTRTEETLTPAQLAASLADKQLVFVGESHTNMDFHRVQLRVLIGLEMYPYTHQKYLDGWVAGHYTEEGFLELSKWYESWQYNWHYYRDIFLFARDNRLPMIALNAPREVVKAVRKKGFENLTDEEAAHIPQEIDFDSEEHRRLFKTFFEEDDSIHASLSEEQWDGMFRAQCTWDATMAFNAVQALEGSDDPRSVMVVLIGVGHVAYGLGIERQAGLWFEGGTASVVPIPLETDDDERIERVQASYGDFLWGQPAETDPIYPSLGLATRSLKDEGLRQVFHIVEDSVAEASGVQVGDVLLAFDGAPLATKEFLGRAVAQMRWGDSAVLSVRRDGEPLDVMIHFRRQADEDEQEDEEEGSKR